MLNFFVLFQWVFLDVWLYWMVLGGVISFGVFFFSRNYFLGGGGFYEIFFFFII